MATNKLVLTTGKRNMGKTACVSVGNFGETNYDAVGRQISNEKALKHKWFYANSILIRVCPNCNKQITSQNLKGAKLKLKLHNKVCK